MPELGRFLGIVIGMFSRVGQRRGYRAGVPARPRPSDGVTSEWSRSFGTVRRTNTDRHKSRILRDAGHRGYVALEHEVKEDPFIAVPKYLAELRKLMSHG